MFVGVAQFNVIIGVLVSIRETVAVVDHVFPARSS
jgi:hypothetical protein